MKDEYIEKVVKRVYPEGHSVWDKITCSSALTLKEFSQWLETEHKLKLTKWDFVIGYKTVIDRYFAELNSDSLYVRVAFIL